MGRGSVNVVLNNLFSVLEAGGVQAAAERWVLASRCGAVKLLLLIQ
jgi:hypothetical protein